MQEDGGDDRTGASKKKKNSGDVVTAEIISSGRW